MIKYRRMRLAGHEARKGGKENKCLWKYQEDYDHHENKEVGRRIILKGS
jgi:hypothetical protein